MRPNSLNPAFIFFLFCLIATPVVLAQPEPKVQVDRVGKQYQLHVEAIVQTPRQRIHAALTDYSNLQQVSPIISSSKQIEPDVVQIMMHGCFLLFCFDKVQTQRITTTPNTVHGEIIPELSDYRSGFSNWQLEDVASGTHITLDTQFVPDFWVPPLIGTYLIQSSMKRQVLKSIEALEMLDKEIESDHNEAVTD